MSEPLSKKLDIKESYIEWLHYDTGYNDCRKDLDQLSPDVNKLAFIIYKVGMRNLAREDEIKLTFNMHHVTWNPTVNECYVKAQEIINQMGVWIVKKG